MTTAARLATDKQIAFATKLIDQLPAGHRLVPTEPVAFLSVQQASALIDALLADQRNRPRPQATPQTQVPAVPDGRYAIDVDDEVHFYKVNTPDQGRWAGRTFVDRQSSDNLYPVRDPAARTRVLTEIAKDPSKASRRYGRLIGACGVCGRTLTDEDSRRAGIGPVCAAKQGW